MFDFRTTSVRKSNTNDTDVNDTDISETEKSDTNDMHKRVEFDNSAKSVSHSNHTNHSNHSHHSTSQELKNSNNEKQEELLHNLPLGLQAQLKLFSNEEIRCLKSVLNKAKCNFNVTRQKSTTSIGGR